MFFKKKMQHDYDLDMHIFLVILLLLWMVMADGRRSERCQELMGTMRAQKLFVF